jgi:DNA-binding CsgD family transcriptional regulator
MKERENRALSQRERETLILAARGMTNKEIAERLCTSTSTIKAIIHQACIKLGARSRGQAIVIVLKRGIVRTDEMYSLEELADMLGSLGSRTIETIAQIVNQKFEQVRMSSDTEPSPSRR